jgi:hypothetical protein
VNRRSKDEDVLKIDVRAFKKAFAVGFGRSVLSACEMTGVITGISTSFLILSEAECPLCSVMIPEETCAFLIAWLLVAGAKKLSQFKVSD